MRKKKIPARRQRLYFICFSLVIVALALTMILTAFRDNIVFFKTPTELIAQPFYKQMRIGGLVEKGSFKELGEMDYEFLVTDTKNSVPVKYKGLLPDLFREGQGVVAEGKYGQDGVFTASEILAKHDENYMPKKVYEEMRHKVEDNNAAGNR